MIEKTWFALLTAFVLLLGCGTADYTELDDFDDDAPASELEDGTEPMPSDPSEQPWGHFWPMDEIDPSEKTNVIMLHGWATEGYLTFREGQEHFEPSDSNHSSLADSDNNLLGRCGRFDGLAQFEWMPCLLPWGKSGSKIWSWTFDFSGCPLDAQYRGYLLEGARRAFLAAQFQSGWLFPETTLGNDPNIVVQCPSLADGNSMRARGAIGVGFPFGQMQFQHAAILYHADVCEEPNSTGAEFNHFSDEYWSYSRGRIYIHWFDFFGYINRELAELRCPSAASTNYAELAKRSAHYVILHELGHVLGYTHHSDTTNTENVMYKKRSCNAFWNVPARFRPFMRNAMWDYDFPHSSAGLHLYDEDLSCYSPL